LSIEGSLDGSALGVAPSDTEDFAIALRPHGFRAWVKYHQLVPALMVQPAPCPGLLRIPLSQDFFSPLEGAGQLSFTVAVVRVRSSVGALWKVCTVEGAPLCPFRSSFFP